MQPPNPQAVMGYPPAVPQMQLPGQHPPQLQVCLRCTLHAD